MQSKCSNVDILIACRQNHPDFQANIEPTYLEFDHLGYLHVGLLHHPKALQFPQEFFKILATTHCQSAHDCAMQAEAMAQQPSSLKDILSQVTAFQGQLTTVQ